ncbi:DUF4270 family protein [uncultured Polaribacter sp.]|uniref:DUF4270 family protein n=1 Tax=uncultured Polaribacter sp. TaxID=174711 RepID=UPI00263418B8|nr:DUF4270 family protein [uncultured Polaribacter sp.]
MKNIFKKSAYLSALVLCFGIIISCEEDFTNINSGVVSNTKFSTNDTIIDVLVSNVPVDRIRTDGLDLLGAPFFGFQGQYLLGAYVNENYESFEASIVSQVLINTGLQRVSFSNPGNLRVETTIDTVFLRIPYQATLQSNTTRPVYSLDSVIGNDAFDLNIFEISAFLNTLNPADPSKRNRYFSDTDYRQRTTDTLNVPASRVFRPTPNDTLLIVKRRNSLGEVHKLDSIRYATTQSPDLALPMAIIGLKKSFAEETFLNNYETPNFASQTAFNDFFRGIIIEAKEKNQGTGQRSGSLISFNLRDAASDAGKSLIEVYYTNTFFGANNQIDTVLTQNHTFQLGGVINNKYNVTNRVYPVNNEVILQGAAGSEAEVKILEPAQLDFLKSKNWLVNDAALTFYINQDSDTTNVPFRLYLYKNGVDELGNTELSQIKDVNTEGEFTFSGVLRYDANNKKDSYTFKITDYLSDFLSGETSDNPPLRLKVFNTSDIPTSATNASFTGYSWNPKAVTILNGDATANGTRRAQLKISYTEKEN